MTTNSRGFSPIIILLLIAVIGGLSVTSYMFLKSSRSPQSTNQNTPKVSPTELKQKTSVDTQSTEPANLLKLASNSILFTMPEKWTYASGTNNCRGNVSANIECIDGASITPGESLPTIYGDGTGGDAFHISVSIFTNPTGHDPKTWFQQDWQEGIGTGKVTTSDTPINGHASFYRLQEYSMDSTSLRELDYAIAVNNWIVLVHARTYEPGARSDGTQVGDFRKFEPQITTMVNTLQVR